MSDWLSGLGPWLKAHPDLMLPLLLSLGMAGCDFKTRRIPNYLTLGGALGGLAFQFGYQGLPGLLDGLAGLGLGFILLLGPYLLGGMGAGDVKASAALGAWLGLRRAFFLFVYMGICGGLIILVMLLWQGRLLAGIREGWNFLLNWLLCRSFDAKPPSPASARTTTIPYGVAMALGMAVLCWRLA
ncbi:MAG: prepilin peptidase [Desulfobaccales bacterium]